jgi:hypothetical protein
LPLPKRRPFTIAKTPRLPVGAGDEGFSIAAILEKLPGMRDLNPESDPDG